MRRFIFWMLLYVVATFAWIVYFEYGADRERYVHGVTIETQRAWQFTKHWTAKLRKD